MFVMMEMVRENICVGVDVILIDLRELKCYVGVEEFVDYKVGYILIVVNYFWKDGML